MWAVARYIRSFQTDNKKYVDRGSRKIALSSAYAHLFIADVNGKLLFTHIFIPGVNATDSDRDSDEDEDTALLNKLSSPVNESQQSACLIYIPTPSEV